MSDRFQITLAQINPTVGDLQGNARLAKEAWGQAKAAGSDLVAFPEMFITGYNAQDLVMKPAFQRAAIAEIEGLAQACKEGPALAIGGPWVEAGALFNAYFILNDGRIVSVVEKHHLPNQSVFDEVRIFSSGEIAGPYSVGNTRIGSPICEDAWHPDVAETLQETGAEFLLVPNGSPYHRQKSEERQNVMVARVIETGLPLIYLNMVGGQDDQVFDGGSFVLNPGGALAVQMPMFESALAHVVLIKQGSGWSAMQGALAPLPSSLEADYHAMVSGLRDYCAKSGFPRVLLGLSGGVDSALVAAIAADALGAENLRAVMLPSDYTSEGSLQDAKDLAENLKCRYDFLPISQGQAAIHDSLAPLFEGTQPDLTEENIQSRLRGLFLMALSNKTRVFEICQWRNAHHREWMQGPPGAIIPQTILDKPPSAELRPDQKDSDSLPDYPVLDAILTLLVDEDQSIDECVAQGFSRQEALRVQNLLYASEYKRFQAAPGTRLSARGFWLDRRYPIVNAWREKG